ncbi:MAG: ABC transporter substrate-binding protein [Defluviitaleaceae bacterium]|nr:ABC transporter substrate-binding protein [Defluviitaleaceae bacterium]
MYKQMAIILFAVALLGLTACDDHPLSATSAQTAGQGSGDFQRVVSLGPNITEIMVGLGVADTLVAIDEHAFDVAGIPTDIPQLSIMPVDAEQLIALAPDLIFAADIVMVEGDDPFSVIAEAGITIVNIPYSDSIAGIMDDIHVIADIMGVAAAGEALIAGMEEGIQEIGRRAEAITERRTVYFEISPAPFMFSFGSGTFLNEMMEIIGADNVLADQESWIAVSDEVILALNPDVILTNVNFLDDPVGEMASRPGWQDAMSAVQGGHIYQIPTNASSRPSQHVVEAMWAMARAIYPEYFN